MKTIRFLAAGLLLGFAVAAAPSCGPSKGDCNSTNCSTGCCDANGECQGGALSSACGTSGGTCAVCPNGQLCNVGVCSTGGGGGGGGGGGNDGGMDGGGGGMDGGGGGGGTIDAVCTTFNGALCDYFVRCGLISSKANCDQVFGSGSECDLEEERSAVKDGRITINSSATTSCANYFAIMASCENFDFEENANCQQLFNGTVSQGGSCFVSEECAATAYCSDDALACPGQCQARKAAGQPANAASECLAGLILYNDTCSARVGPGQNCGAIAPSNEDQECASGYFCNANSVCEAKKAQGVACASGSECSASLQCANGTCNPLVGVGGTCSYQTAIYCKYDLACDVSTFTAPGTCGERKAAGGACFVGSDCKSDLFCLGANFGVNPPVKGSCVAKRAPNTSCADSDECLDGYCSAGTCKAAGARGAACTLSEECGGSLDCFSGTCNVDECADPTP